MDKQREGPSIGRVKVKRLPEQEIRKCARPECGRKLSIHNKGKECFSHSSVLGGKPGEQGSGFEGRWSQAKPGSE